MDKKQLRRKFLDIRSGISSADRRKADRAIGQSVMDLPEYRNASIVAGYASDGTEPDILPVLRDAAGRGIRACLPKWNGTQYILSLVDENDLDGLIPGKWDLPEPRSIRPADEFLHSDGVLYLVPGVAFDEKLNRLGRGGGVYDRILKDRGSSTALGIFYECQLCAGLPVENHDIPLDVIVTDSAVRRSKQPGMKLPEKNK